MLWLDAPLAQGEAKHRLQHDVTDAFKMFKNFPVAIAVFDADKDGDLDCVVSVRSTYDEEGHTATYTWLLPGFNGHEKQNITFNLREGASPDKPVYTPEDECMLWMSQEAVKDIPQNCVDHFEDNCDIKNPAYDEDSCSPVMANL
ncbi:hypothetical protein MTO96_027657 [Rhipicephalus appendiculatus]